MKTNSKKAVKLELPTTTKVKGLFLFCNGCKKQYSDGKSAKCKCDPEKLIYKIKIHIPNTNSRIRAKNLETRELEEAIIQTLAFEKELKRNSFQKIEIKEDLQIPNYLTECMARFICFLKNEDVPEQYQKNRSQKYIKAMDTYLTRYVEALSSKGYDVSLLKFTDINSTMAGVVYKYATQTLHYKNKTFNHFIDSINRFTNYTIKTYYSEYKNPFSDITKKMIFPKNYSISQKEFQQVLEAISPDECFITSKVKSRKNIKRKSVYKPWLKDAYLLGLYTGGRREEIVELKWSGIKLYDSGEFSHIEINHFKINRMNNNIVSDEEYEVKEFLITGELANLLMELGYEKYKNTDKYILAPESDLNRGNMMDIISRSFSIFYKKLNNGKERQFKDLRKTFISSAVDKFGGAATALTKHKGIDVIRKHYLDLEVLKKAQKSFSVYGD